MQMLPALSLFFIMVSPATIRPAAVAKESRDMCEEIQVFRGVQDTRALPGKLFFYPISPFAFRGTIAHYKVTLANGSVLPKWLEYNPNTSTLQGLPMLEESGEYHLTVAAHGEACDPNIQVATANFTLRVHNYITLCENRTSTNQKAVNDITGPEGLCSRDIPVTFAEIIIYHKAGSLSIQERFFLIYTMAEYLYLDLSFLTLIPFKESFNKHLWNLTVLSEDTKYISSTMENHYVSLCWPVGFGVFAMLYELVKILQHNVQSNHLSQLLGKEIAGWRILRKGSNKKKHVGKRNRRQLMVTPRPTLRPTKIGVKPTKMEALTFCSTTLLHAKFAVKSSASSSSLYEGNETAVPSYTNIYFHSITNQRDLGTLHVLSVCTRPLAFTVSQSLTSAVPELSPSLMTASLTDFGIPDDLYSRTPPLSEFPQSQVQQQYMHSTPKKSEPQPHFTQHYLNFSVPASKTQSSRPIQPTMNASVSQKGTSYEKMLVAHFPKTIVINLTHSSPYVYLTPSGFASEDTFFTANFPVLSIMSTVAKVRFPFSSVATSLFFLDCNHQNQDLLSNGRYALETFMSSPQMSEYFFMEENTFQISIVLTETSKWAMHLNLTDITSTSHSATTGSASVHEVQLTPDISPVPQLYYSNKIPTLTTYTTQELIISLFTCSVAFGLLSSIPMELPSLPLSTLEELTGSIKFHTISPVEELWSMSRCVSQNVFKTEEHTSETFLTVQQTNQLFFMKNKASTLTNMLVKTPLWNEPCHFIYITKSGSVVLGSQFLGVGSLCQGASQKHLWYSYDNLLLSLSLVSAGAPTLQFSTNYFSSYANGGVETPEKCCGVLQLETSDLILTSPLETKTAFSITIEFSSQLLEDSTVTSLQTELHSTSVFPGVHGQRNTSPRVVKAINWITATIGHKFSFSVPPNTFYDQEDGDTSQLTLGMNPADGSPIDPGNWLYFNSCFQTMHGYPLANDFQYSPQEFLLFATDSEGLKTSDKLTIELVRPTSIPCHNYTIRTKNSYHSFLRKRERVYLFFEKISKYLSSGNPGSMILLSLRPGSTLITWYDNSFCAKNNRCARDEIEGILVKLRVSGGKVNPDFVQAMLPEYSIYHIENVAYGGTCSSHESLISNQTITSFKECHSWTRFGFFALLMSMCAVVMLILIMTVCYSKYNKRIIGSESMSFHERPFISYANLEMNVLKSKKSAVLEPEVPWPAELWLPVPTPSQQHSCRPSANFATSSLPSPPKYRLPRLYGIDGSSQTSASHARLKSSTKARLL